MYSRNSLSSCSFFPGPIVEDHEEFEGGGFALLEGQVKGLRILKNKVIDPKVSPEKPLVYGANTRRNPDRSWER